MVRQYPDAFQYDDRVLVFLADHMFSGLFGTFLGDCERERVRDLRCPSDTTSVWSYVLGRADQFLNRRYTDAERAAAAAHQPTNLGVLRMRENLSPPPSFFFIWYGVYMCIPVVNLMLAFFVA